MSQPLVSFVVPVYKKPVEVLERCLSSLFDMSSKDIEVICVFDGADPLLYDVAGKFKKAKKIVVDHGGAPKARNAGLDAATGKYVAFWDADCYAKPDMAKRWLEEFKATDADFVYTGYEFAGERGAFESEDFDAYSLQCGNFISSMAPILREKAPRWDETLKGGQDWDYWLTAVERGCKGAFIPGAGFTTEPSFQESISHSAWAPDRRELTIKTIKEKHGIPIREIGVYTMNYRHRGLKLAKILGADFIKETGSNPLNYKTIFCLGYGFMSRFDGFAPEVTKIQYWLPGEIDGLAEAKYQVVMETIRIAKGVINLCNTQYEKNKLAELGVTAEVVPLPLLDEDTKNVKTDLPEDFSILLIADESYGKLLKEIQQDLPHIKFGYNAGKVQDYSCLMSFYTFAPLDEAILVALVNGRNVISNVQAPYCGFIDPVQSWDDFKRQLYEKIREVKGATFNKEAQDYYLELTKASKFQEAIRQLLPKPSLEVIQ